MRSNAVLVLVFASFFTSTVFAKIDTNLKGDELVQAVVKATKDGHHSVSYSAARKDLFGDIYLEKDGNNNYFVTDVYCDKQIPSKGPGFVPDNTVLNVEHTWPQSQFSGATGQEKTDMHHLFPADSKANGVRGNYPFGIVVKSMHKQFDCPISDFGQDASGNLVFQPPANHRGNVARALFYFSMRYGLAIKADEEAVLRQWNKEDPVDQDEVVHNDVIEQLQGNRNPFVDQPELVDMIQDF